MDVGDFAVFAASFGGGVSAECGVFDFEPDGDVDLADFGSFCVSFTGSGSPLPGDCVRFDREPDGDVDLSDFAVFAACFTGAGSAAPANPYYFTGRRLDFDIRDDGAGQTGRPGRPLLALYDYRAREYDPWHGRFTSRDPAEYAESLNLYQYVLSNPQAHTDSSGRSLLLDLLAGVSNRLNLQARAAAFSATMMGYFRNIAEALSWRNQMLTGIVNAASRMGQRGADFLIRADQVMRGAAGRMFTANTYRDAYIWLRGGIQENFAVHHIFPQRFVDFFASKGINIHVPLWLEEIEMGAHARLSTAYNAAWEQWIWTHRSATTQEVFNYARVLMLEIFGIEAPF